MIYIVNKSTDPAYNIALEEYCFKRLMRFEKIFILWINEPAIIVGKYQNTMAEINERYVKEQGIHVVRRITGGGAVYHDLDNLNYTIISKEEEGRSDFDFEAFSQPVIEALAGLGVKAEFSGRNDITIDGKKVCGNAQAYADGRVMHHGCLLFNTDLTVLSKALEPPKETVRSKAIKSVRSRVDNILPHLKEEMSVHQFADKVLEQMVKRFPEMQPYTFNESELQEIERARREICQLGLELREQPAAEVTRASRYPAGKIEVFLDLKGGKIEKIRFFGTFFGRDGDLTEVENRLKGTRYTRGEVREALSTVDVPRYFTGFTLEELVEAIVD